MACGSVNDVKKCVLHVDQKVANNDKGILLFTEESLAKCKKAQLVYENREKSKKLPTVLDGLGGWLSCKMLQFLYFSVQRRTSCC